MMFMIFYEFIWETNKFVIVSYILYIFKVKEQCYLFSN